MVGTMQGELKPMEYESESEEEDEEEVSTAGSAAEQRCGKICYHDRQVLSCEIFTYSRNSLNGARKGTKSVCRFFSDTCQNFWLVLRESVYCLFQFIYFPLV